MSEKKPTIILGHDPDEDVFVYWVFDPDYREKYGWIIHAMKEITAIDDSTAQITWLTRADLEAVVLRVLGEYPWMANHPIRCHRSCARWDIEREYGPDAGDAWYELDCALFLLGHEGAGNFYPTTEEADE